MTTKPLLRSSALRLRLVASSAPARVVSRCVSCRVSYILTNSLDFLARSDIDTRPLELMYSATFCISS